MRLKMLFSNHTVQPPLFAYWEWEGLEYFKIEISAIGSNAAGKISIRQEEQGQEEKETAFDYTVDERSDTKLVDGEGYLHFTG